MNYKTNFLPSILFIDSGIGGLSTLSSSFNLTHANYIYFADNKYAPYGTKSDKFLKERLLKIINFFSKKYNISIIVLACNTATTTAISFLRENFPNLLFIGTEPAYNVAIFNNFKKPALIATPQTINHIKEKGLQTFLLFSHKTLASQIEENLTSNSPFSNLKILKSLYFLKHKTKKNDCLILGCTHYILLKEKISKIINLPIIDGNHGVSNQIHRLYSENQSSKSSFKIILSQENKLLLQKYKKILKQILANQINLC